MKNYENHGINNAAVDLEKIMKTKTNIQKEWHGNDKKL